jgi:hypothetical protein
MQRPKDRILKGTSMSRNILAVVFLLFAASLAQAAEPDAAAFVAEAKKLFYAPPQTPLKSFSGDISLRHSPDPKTMAVRDKVRFGYSWNAPDREDFAWLEVPKLFQGPLRLVVGGLWRDLSGVLVFDWLEGAGDLTCASKDGVTVLRGTHKETGKFQAHFDEKSKRLLKMGVEGKGRLRGLEFRYTFATKKKDDRSYLVLGGKDVLRNGTLQMKFVYEAVLTVSGFWFPTVFTVRGKDGRVNSFNVRYATVNGKPARMEAVSTDDVKAAVAAFKKNWRKWDELEKTAQMRKLAKFGHDLASSAIAKYGLRDRDPAVRREAAVNLGEMGRRNVTGDLIAVMKPNEKYIETYKAVIHALGRIGDPRAIGVLSKDWWNQGERGTAYDAARAKIDALGLIRDKRSVDAIIDVFYIAPDHALGPVANNIVRSLSKLTGQNFGRNRRAWKDWWKKNRASHRFD